MPVPFPSPTFPANFTPYPLKAPVAPSLNHTGAFFFRQAPPPANIYYFDMVSLTAHVATVTSNNGSSLVINSEGQSLTFNLTGDGSAEVPVGVLASP